MELKKNEVYKLKLAEVVKERKHLGKDEEFKNMIIEFQDSVIELINKNLYNDTEKYYVLDFILAKNYELKEIFDKLG
jgi:hypothetical protein